MSSNFIIKKIEHGSKEYLQALDLRLEILRKPLGLVYSKEDLEGEEQNHHFALVYAESVEAYLLLKPISDSNLKMRQVAVSSSHQGKGWGKKLVRFAESWAQQNGYLTIDLDARETAVPFYRHLGYEIEGSPFISVTLPHFRMSKVL